MGILLRHPCSSMSDEMWSLSRHLRLSGVNGPSSLLLFFGVRRPCLRSMPALHGCAPPKPGSGFMECAGHACAPCLRATEAWLRHSRLPHLWSAQAMPALHGCAPPQAMPAPHACAPWLRPTEAWLRPCSFVAFVADFHRLRSALMACWTMAA